jgi:uncharacterized integral membrane protein
VSRDPESRPGAPRAGKGPHMALGYFVVALVAAAVAVFALQNGTPVSVKFLVWTPPAVSLAALVLGALAAGLIVVGLPLWIQRWRLRSRVRTLTTQVRQLETSLADRERALLAQRTSPAARPPSPAPDSRDRAAERPV